MDRKKQQVPFDFAQGRLSTSLRFGSTAGRDRRDDNFVCYRRTDCSTYRAMPSLLLSMSSSDGFSGYRSNVLPAVKPALLRMEFRR